MNPECLDYYRCSRHLSRIVRCIGLLRIELLPMNPERIRTGCCSSPNYLLSESCFLSTAELIVSSNCCYWYLEARSFEFQARLHYRRRRC